MSARDRELVSRLRERDERAFRELVGEHRDRVFNLTYRMLGNRAEAEDVAQEVFITVFKTIDSFREEAKFSTWLYRVAVNHCKNRIKYLSRRHDRSQDELDENAGAVAAAGPPGPMRRPDRAVEGAQMEVVLLGSRVATLPGLTRYDTILVACVAIQVALVALRIETWDEVAVLALFHGLGLGLELWKTDPRVGSWSYPEAADLAIGRVPLYAGFMYAAVASFICQAWRRCARSRTCRSRRSARSPACPTAR